MEHSVELELGGKKLRVETGRVARQANGAVLLHIGETVILATATMSKAAREGCDFFPLTCDYEERKYAVGKIPGGFVKRGGRPSERAILTSRLIDRPVRPLFPDGMRNDVQVIAMPVSVDLEVVPDVMAVTAAAFALAVSDIPFQGPMAAVRVTRVEGELIVNPSYEQTQAGDIDLVAEGLPPDSSAAVLLYENLWAVKTMAALVDAGAFLLMQERIPHDVVVEALADIAELSAQSA